MASNAVGTPLNVDFRRIDFNVSADLFSRAGVTIVNNTTISGGVQGGAVNIGSGQASNEGTVSNHTTHHKLSRRSEAISPARSKPCTNPH